jgi:hypothetical protein
MPNSLDYGAFWMGWVNKDNIEDCSKCALKDLCPSWEGCENFEPKEKKTLNKKRKKH